VGAARGVWEREICKEKLGVFPEQKTVSAIRTKKKRSVKQIFQYLQNKKYLYGSHWGFRVIHYVEG
jgi:hypothetical protein